MPTLPHQVLIGPKKGQPDRSGEYPNTTAGIMQALNDGARWLVFLSENVHIDAIIDLDTVQTTPRYLRLEAAGDFTVNFNKEFSGGPMLRATQSLWAFDWRGVAFQGRTDPNDDGQDIVLVDRIYRSRFTNCHWTSGYGRGLSLGAVTAEDILFDHCTITKNDREGLHIQNARRITIHKCIIERNGQDDIPAYPSLVMRGNPPDAWRGLSNIIDNHLEADLTAHVAIDLDNVRFTNVRRNYVALAKLRLGAGTTGCEVKRNRMITVGDPMAGEIIDQGIGNSVPDVGIDRNLYYD